MSTPDNADEFRTEDAAIRDLFLDDGSSTIHDFVDDDDLHPDLLSEPVDGPVEATAHAELGEVLTRLNEADRQEKARFESATDSEYWICVCFQTRAQKDTFLAALTSRGVRLDGDKYVRASSIAKHLGIELPRADLPPIDTARGKRLVREIGLIGDHPCEDDCATSLLHSPAPAAAAAAPPPPAAVEALGPKPQRRKARV